jgi:ubiquinone/menaquinone biosynthesis C-methylase UbiE
VAGRRTEGEPRSPAPAEARGGARCTGLQSDAVDVVHARLLLVNIPAPDAVLEEMARLVKPGGAGHARAVGAASDRSYLGVQPDQMPVTGCSSEPSLSWRPARVAPGARQFVVNEKMWGALIMDCRYKQK